MNERNILQPQCKYCIHADVCMRRATFEMLFENEEIMAPLKRVNEMTDWIVVDMRCKDYDFDYRKQLVDVMDEPEKKRLFRMKWGNKDD